MTDWRAFWNKDALTVKYEHDKKSAQTGGLAAKLTNTYFENTTQTDTSFLPVGFEERLFDRSYDIIGQNVKRQEIALMSTQEQQGFLSLFQQGQYVPVNNGNRPTANTFTAELVHPSGEGTSQFRQFSFMPVDPTVFQMERARKLAAAFGSAPMQHRTEQPYMRAAPNVTFRYQSTGS